MTDQSHRNENKTTKIELNNTKNKNHDPLIQISLLSLQALRKTEKSIESRKKLTRRFLHEIEKEIAEAVKMLRFLGDPWKHGDKTDYEFMRISLDKALTARKKERRERLLQEWKDLFNLKEKRLELLKENIALEIGGNRNDGKDEKNNHKR